MDIKNKVVVVTGGGGGIGRAVCLHIARLGGKVAVIDLNDEAMAETVRQVEDAGSEARAYHCSVADEAQVEASFNKIVADFGGLHGLVNNAGVLRDGLLVKAKDGKVIKKLSLDDFNLVTDVNMKGPFLCAREAAAHMIEQGVEDACIVNLSSAVYRGNYGQTSYCSSKTAVVSMARVWAKELGQHNIRAMAVAPGAIKTDMLAGMPQEILEKMAKSIPLGRIGHVDNIAQTIVMIFENDYLSGDIIEVNGGLFIG
jgi:3-oxoacyl-[acyl-carrier protein] reductase